MTALQHRFVARVAELRPGTTMCPGQLCRDCGTTLAQGRDDLLALAHAGRVVLKQRGRVLKPGPIHGPFRVAPGSQK